MSFASINDTEIFYLSEGEGVPCLVMHGGLGFDHTYLHPWLDSLGDVLNLVYYDHRGNGRSGRPPKETMTHVQFVEDAVGLADHLGFEEFAVMGHSYGGFIALELALRYPQRLSHLILMDTAPAFNYFFEVIRNARRKGASDEMIAILAEGYADDEDMRRKVAVIAPLYFKYFEAEIAVRMYENIIMNASGGAKEGERDDYNVVPHLDKIRTPTLILVGRDDFVCPPSQAEILHEGIPDSELVIFEHSGHFPYVEEADNFTLTVRDWIERQK